MWWEATLGVRLPTDSRLGTWGYIVAWTSPLLILWCHFLCGHCRHKVFFRMNPIISPLYILPPLNYHDDHFNRSNQFIFVCNKDTSGEQLCPTSFMGVHTFIKQSITFLFYPLVPNKWFTFTVTSKGVIAIVWTKPLQEHLCSHCINYACNEHRLKQTCHIKKLSTHKYNVQLLFYEYILIRKAKS